MIKEFKSDGRGSFKEAYIEGVNRMILKGFGVSNFRMLVFKQTDFGSAKTEIELRFIFIRMCAAIEGDAHVQRVMVMLAFGDGTREWGGCSTRLGVGRGSLKRFTRRKRKEKALSSPFQKKRY
jgi:hypothetical protein